MKLLSSLVINNKLSPAIELLHGDLSQIPAEHAADILVVSAFPGDYKALPDSLFESLEKKNLSMAEIAKEKDMDLRDQLGCWISRSLSPEQKKKFNFSRILCFEPQAHSTDPSAVVGNIFRCINTFAFDKKNNSIIMPVLATGYQKASITKMLPALLKAAVFWLQNGLPLAKIKLVIYRDKYIPGAIKIFDTVKQQYEKKYQQPPAMPPSVAPPASEVVVAPPSISTGATVKMDPPKPQSAGAKKQLPDGKRINEGYDIFISYAHKQKELVDPFVKALQKHNNNLNIFYDSDSIKGGQWIKLISDAIQQSEKVLILLSPDYTNSPVCWDEFQCAKLVEYNSKKSLIQTIYLYDDKKLPPIMGIYSYIDCREGSSSKLEQAIEALFTK